MNLSDITLIVAAGGRSTRMGRDKRFLDLAGETLLARTLRKGRAAGFREIILAAEGETEELRAVAAAFGARLAVDERPAQGPAAAIAAGLAVMTAEWALVLSGDMPFYDFDLVRALLSEAHGDRQVVLPTLLGYWQPLAALYRREAGTAFAAGIARGDRKLGIILRELAVKELPLTVDAGLFFNVNTPPTGSRSDALRTSGAPCRCSRSPRPPRGRARQPSSSGSSRGSPRTTSALRSSRATHTDSNSIRRERTPTDLRRRARLRSRSARRTDTSFYRRRKYEKIWGILPPKSIV